MSNVREQRDRCIELEFRQQNPTVWNNSSSWSFRADWWIKDRSEELDNKRNIRRNNFHLGKFVHTWLTKHFDWTWKFRFQLFCKISESFGTLQDLKGSSSCPLLLHHADMWMHKALKKNRRERSLLMSIRSLFYFLDHQRSKWVGQLFCFIFEIDLSSSPFLAYSLNFDFGERMLWAII